jgi:hypothetical protein
VLRNDIGNYKNFVSLDLNISFYIAFEFISSWKITNGERETDENIKLNFQFSVDDEE